MNFVPFTTSIPLPDRPDWPQAARYLGGEIQDKTTQALLEQAAPGLWQAARPRGVWVCLPLEGLDPWPLGSDLERHLAGCSHALLLAVTLGPQVDRLLTRLSATQLAQAAAADALASTLVEQSANWLEGELRRQLAEDGLYLTGRFGPGYGDSPLDLQPMVCRTLDSVRKLGLAASESLLLTPRKSTTAILGVADHPVTGRQAGCEHCKLRSKCNYRKRGTSCGAEKNNGK